MRTLPWAILAASVLVGCARNHSIEDPVAPAAAGAASGKLIVTPQTTLVGKVARVSAGGRFVILNFPIGHLPALDQRLGLYRLGVKVGEVRVSGPQLDDNIAADLLAGEALPGDEVREP